MRSYNLAKILFFAVVLILLSGCGYRIGDGGLSRYQTISIPFVEGDWDGDFTSEIAKEISKSGAFEYKREDGALILFIKLIDLRDENIGFRYDRKKRGTIKKSIIPTETRITAFVEIKVVEAASNEVVLGPVILSSSIDFDHDWYNSRHAVNIFSLGQLSDIDAAREAVGHPLNEALAKKIADYLSDSW